MDNGDQIGIATDLVDAFDADPASEFTSERSNLGSRSDLDANQSRQADASLTNGIAANDPLFFHPLHACAHRALGDVNSLGDLDERCSGRLSKHGQDGPIKGIDCYHVSRRNQNPICMFAANYHRIKADYFPESDNIDYYSLKLHSNGTPFP